MSINYLDRIPNNVDLGSNRTLQRARTGSPNS